MIDYIDKLIIVIEADEKLELVYLQLQRTGKTLIMLFRTEKVRVKYTLLTIIVR